MASCVFDDMREGLLGLPIFPMRPSVLPEVDADVVALVKAAKSSHASARDRDLARTFGAWRYEVLKAEGAAESNLVVILWAADVLERASDPEDMLGDLVAYLRDTYGVHPPIPSTHRGRERLAKKRTRAYADLPRCLREEYVPRVDRIFVEGEDLGW